MWVGWNVLGSRVCLIWRPLNHGSDRIANARICVLPRAPTLPNSCLCIFEATSCNIAYPVAARFLTVGPMPQIDTGATSVPLNERSTNMLGSDVQREKPTLTFLTNEQPAFVGAVIRFQDGTCWQLTKVSSNLAHQQADPPFEAR